MSWLAVEDPAALEAALDALPVGTWAEVTTAGETFRLERVPGGRYLPGDLDIESGDIAAGRPTSVAVLGE